jgi:uncharacterized membrane protein HdeD (DUF308 family)
MHALLILGIVLIIISIILLIYTYVSKSDNALLVVGYIFLTIGIITSFISLTIKKNKDAFRI